MTNETRALLVQLACKLAEHAKLEAGWDGRGSKPVGLEVLTGAADLGVRMIDAGLFATGHLNLGPSPDGDLLFSLLPGTGREADIWIEGGKPGVFVYVIQDESGDTEEGALPFAGIWPIQFWLGNPGTPWAEALEAFK